MHACTRAARRYIEQLAAAGVGHLRVELTDQPGRLVGPRLERYSALARGDADAAQVLSWLDAELEDSTGHRPGVTTGSFRPSTERKWASLRPTAAEERANAARR